MLVEFDRTIDSDQDVVDMNKRILFPYGTPFYDMYRGSPIEIQRQIAGKVSITFLCMTVSSMYV